jgi:hypothetical protein
VTSADAMNRIGHFAKDVGIKPVRQTFSLALPYHLLAYT